MIELRRPLLLTGMKHCGKSTVGKILAARFSVPFFDLDSLVEDIFFRRTGERLSSREIYRMGSDVFMKYETAAAEEAAAHAGEPPVVAAGGGIVDNPEALSILDKHLKIYISESAEVLFERIIAGGLPAFLSEEDPYGSFLKLFEKRTSEYDRLSDITVESVERGTEEIAREISERLQEENYAR